MCAFADAGNSNSAAATGAEVLFANSHRFDMALLRRDIVDYDRFTFGADHGQWCHPA